MGSGFVRAGRVDAALEPETSQIARELKYPVYLPFKMYARGRRRRRRSVFDMPRAKWRDGEQLVWDERCARNLGLVVRHAFQVSLESLRIVLSA
jgi:hypothetical protein